MGNGIDLLLINPGACSVSRAGAAGQNRGVGELDYG